MAITRWSPAFTLAVDPRDRVSVQNEVDRLFDGFFGRFSQPQSQPTDAPAAFVPAVDVEEVGDEFVFRVDLPGVAQKDVKVLLMGDTLTIRGSRSRDTDRENSTVHRGERLHGSFERAFTLGTPVRNDQVRASYRDGVLEVHVPKLEEAKLEEIEVQVG